ncbi:hypothetical protein EV179_003227 [Coemansia sp. RSA 487]|nr:hypothetical protein LPJ74_004870 [Coemansia sp. RSA 1843]KAJ2214207.1 hypothetical protein EV179_003227 [Coemansia sp. RSA 487]
MKLNIASTIAVAASFSTAAIGAPMSTATVEPATATHDLHTFTDEYGLTLLIDYGNTAYVGLELGLPGVDGIYAANGPQQTASGTDTWVDVHDGVEAVIDYAHPNHYTVYDSAHSPIATISYEPDTASAPESTAPPHYLMTFANGNGEVLLVDEAVDNAGILEAGIPGVDGVYMVPAGGFPVGEGTGLETWVDSADGIQVVLDRADPNHYTVYDASGSPIQTGGF